ncbi:MAG: hypothetical protein U0136_12300 [Bdellovibrionota bacterium]
MANERKPQGEGTTAPEPTARKSLPGSIGDSIIEDFGFGSVEEEVIPRAAPREIEDPLTVGVPQVGGWRVAAAMVSRFRPVPQLMWPIVHAVYGKPGDLGEPDAMFFSSVGQLVVRASQDKTLNRSSTPNTGGNLTQSVTAIGSDVAAAVCLIHAVCRKVSTVVAERVSRPILDDALLRTHIGYYVGMLSPSMGAGRGMLAGFAGRCGLAVQIAAGEIDQAQRALTGMASGQDMTIVCNNVYGCDPLEVAALTLISGGCCREIAFGISSYSATKKDIVPGSEQYRWLSLFSVIEAMRMGRVESISPELWSELGYTTTSQEELRQHIVASQRRGHGWSWLTQSQVLGGKAADGGKDAKESKPSRKGP